MKDQIDYETRYRYAQLEQCYYTPLQTIKQTAATPVQQYVHIPFDAISMPHDPKKNTQNKLLLHWETIPLAQTASKSTLSNNVPDHNPVGNTNCRKHNPNDRPL